MGKFFESDMVREELTEIINFNKNLFVYNEFSYYVSQGKLEHIDKLTELLENKRYVCKLSLSDDPEAELLSTLKSSIALMGFPPNMDMNSFLIMYRRQFKH